MRAHSDGMKKIEKNAAVIVVATAMSVQPLRGSSRPIEISRFMARLWIRGNDLVASRSSIKILNSILRRSFVDARSMKCRYVRDKFIKCVRWREPYGSIQLISSGIIIVDVYACLIDRGLNKGRKSCASSDTRFSSLMQFYWKAKHWRSPYKTINLTKFIARSRQ